MKAGREGLLVVVRDIPAGGLVLEGEILPADLGIDSANKEFSSPVRYLLRLNVAGMMVLASGEVRAAVSQVCSRCLVPLEIEAADEDLDVSLTVASPEETIDLTDIVRDYTLLSLPRKPLCSPSCRGLCPRCGEDLNRGECSCAQGEARSPFAGLDGIFAKE